MARVTFTPGNQFFSILNNKVDQYFASNNLKYTGNWKLYLKTIILFASSVIIYSILVFFTPPIWISSLLCLVLGFAIAGIGFNVMHDGAHGSYSSKKWLNDMMGYSLNLMGGNTFLWKIKHNVNHHSFTNIEGMDDDICLKPWIRISENQPKYWFHKFQNFYWFLFYSLAYIAWVFFLDFDKYFSKKIADTPIKKIGLKEHFIFWISKIIYVGLFIIVPVFSVGLLKTLVGYLITSFAVGLIISIVFQLAHIVEDTNFPEADEKLHSKVGAEWAVHQLLTTANFATKSKIISWFTGGLNFQIEHHLFPKISHIHYPAISKFVRETAEQFNIPYIEYPTLLSAIQSHINHLKIVGAK